MSCDKELDKFNGVVSSPKGNWDAMPYKDHPPEILGRFGMTNFGSLAKKIKRLEGKDLPLLNRKNNTLNNSQTGTLWFGITSDYSLQDMSIGFIKC